MERSMEYRKSIDTTAELAEWYNNKYTEMGDGWHTPAEQINQHLDDLGVPFDRNKRLLDVGCGAGHFVVEAQKRCFTIGIEISQVGARLTLMRGANSVCVGSIETVTEFDPFDYIVSMGSLEHIVDLDKALDNIRNLLKPDGQFYFLCPNELWKHYDQPNERAMTDNEWVSLFRDHRLYVKTIRRWNDSTVFIGSVIPDNNLFQRVLPPHGNKLNIGSGQRRFDAGQGWINVDCVSRPPDQIPDLVCGAGVLPYPDESMDIAVLHQVYEHFGLGEGHGVIRELYRTLKVGGSIIITVPDMRSLASRWLSHQIDDYIFMVNTYGAYQGLDGDRHKWGYTYSSLCKDLATACSFYSIRPFDWRPIVGADIARDWWILGVEAIK